jgi:ribosome-binding factor A
MPSPTRLKRISDRIRQEISEMLVMGEISDPRLVGVSITDVNVDREFSYANIFVSAVEGHAREAEILQGLKSARGYLRKQLAARIELRTFPQLRFHWDPTPERADHIERLLDTIKAQEAKGKRK